MITSAPVLAAIPTTPNVVICGWLELNAWIDSNPLTFDFGALVFTHQLQELWQCSQPTVSRRIAGINRAGLASIKHARGYQGGWWVRR